MEGLNIFCVGQISKIREIVHNFHQYFNKSENSQHFGSISLQCLFYIWKVVLSISKGFHFLLDTKLKSLKLFENASIPFEDNLVIH